jgi:hypothetical protein
VVVITEPPYSHLCGQHTLHIKAGHEKKRKEHENNASYIGRISSKTRMHIGDHHLKIWQHKANGTQHKGGGGGEEKIYIYRERYIDIYFLNSNFNI